MPCQEGKLPHCRFAHVIPFLSVLYACLVLCSKSVHTLIEHAKIRLQIMNQCGMFAKSVKLCWLSGHRGKLAHALASQLRPAGLVEFDKAMAAVFVAGAEVRLQHQAGHMLNLCAQRHAGHGCRLCLNVSHQTHHCATTCDSFIHTFTQWPVSTAPNCRAGARVSPA